MLRTLKLTLAAIRKSVLQRGVSGTLKRCVAEPWYQLQDWRFDRKHKVRTAGFIPARDLDIEDTDRRNASAYEPVRLHAFSELMDILDIRYQDFVFIDFGSGKGRALLLASEFPFRKIVGVELSPALCGTARDNVRRYRSRTRRCQHIEVTCQNALTLSLPPQPAVLYFYNPFREEVMRPVLGNLCESLLRHPRQVFLVLYNPVLESLVKSTGFLTLFKTTGRCSVYRTADSFLALHGFGAPATQLAGVEGQ